MSGKPPILMRKDRGRLVPVDAWSAEQLDAYPEGKDLNVRITSNRSVGGLNLYWAGLGLLVENMDDETKRRWPTARKFHNTLMEEIGLTERIWRIDGTFRLVPDSIALDSMSNEDFLDYWENAKRLIIRHFGYDPFELWVANKGSAK